jgi:hypothetical protein
MVLLGLWDIKRERFYEKKERRAISVSFNVKTKRKSNFVICIPPKNTFENYIYV